MTAIDEFVKRGLKEAIPVLIEILRKEEKNGNELLRQARKALVNLTDQDLGAADSWQAWWDKNKDAFKVGEKPPASGGGGTVVETIKRNRTTAYENLKKGGKEDIVVVEGEYDKIQDVVAKLAIPHTVVPKNKFNTVDLSKCMALLINCDSGSPRFTRAQIDKIRDFVKGGGYLFTSDWGLEEVLQQAFPGYVKVGGTLGQMNVAILPKKGSTGHPFLREVFVKAKDAGGKEEIVTRIDHRWEIDEESFAIDYDPKRVVALVESPELAKISKHIAVAVTFSFGDDPKNLPPVATGGGVYEDLPKMKGGKVLHILSHFGKQKNKNDDFALQNMLLNFLMEAKERKPVAPPKKGR